MVPLPFIAFVFQRYFSKVKIQNQIIILKVKGIDEIEKYLYYIDSEEGIKSKNENICLRKTISSERSPLITPLSLSRDI